MPHLEIFKLDVVEFEEMIWNTNDGGFQMLKFLKLYIVYFKEWNTLGDHFPVLEHLVLEGCLHLKLIPSDLGYIPTLQKIEVLLCKKEIINSAKNIQEEQEAQGNELLKISISGIYWTEDGDGDEDKDEDRDEDKDKDKDKDGDGDGNKDRDRKGEEDGDRDGDDDGDGDGDGKGEGGEDRERDGDGKGGRDEEGDEDGSRREQVNKETSC